MEYKFYKKYSNPNNLAEFDYIMDDEDGHRRFEEWKWMDWWNKKGQPEIIIESGSNEIDIIDGVPVLNLSNIKLNQKSQINSGYKYQFSQGLLTKESIKIDCNYQNLAYLQNLLTYCNSNSLAEITINDFDNEPQTITVNDLISIINQTITYHLYLNQKKLGYFTSIDNATTYNAIKAIEFDISEYVTSTNIKSITSALSERVSAVEGVLEELL